MQNASLRSTRSKQAHLVTFSLCTDAKAGGNCPRSPTKSRSLQSHVHRPPPLPVLASLFRLLLYGSAVSFLCHFVAMATQQLSQSEIWDDSALVDSWNEAVEEYKVCIPEYRRLVTLLMCMSEISQYCGQRRECRGCVSSS